MILINMPLSASFLLIQEEGGTRPNPHTRRLGLREPSGLELSSRCLTVLIESFEHITVKLVKVTHSGKFKQRQVSCWVKEASCFERDAAGSVYRQLTVRSCCRHLTTNPEETGGSSFHGQTSRRSVDRA